MIDPTLHGILSEVENDQVVLPAMQRPFVWRENRIYYLVDSLLRRFPIGAIMLWKTATLQRYRRILREIDAKSPQIFSYETSVENDSKYLVLDGQQRLTSLFVAFKGLYNHRRLFIDILSGPTEDKDPGDIYYDCRFLADSEVKALNSKSKNGRRHYLPMRDLVRIYPESAPDIGYRKAHELGLTEAETKRVVNVYLRCAAVMGKTLQVIIVDANPPHITPIEEILEIFVRVNSGGLVLYKSDLLMSLLDLKWNNIQPELQELVRDANENRPFEFTRDDILKSLLLAVGAETRFDRIVKDRKQVEELAEQMPSQMPQVRSAWERLGCILTDDCKIHSERFFRGGHRSLLPFVLYLSRNSSISNENKRKLVIGIYLSVMSGIFSGAEARMGGFARKTVANSKDFPLKELARLIRRQYGIDSLDRLLQRHLDLTLNIVHGGITLDKNPDELQRDHIFPRSKLEGEGYSYELVNHYANFHFLRASDNANKSNKPPHEWFKKPGTNSPYTDRDLEERLLTWELLEPGQFEKMLEVRGRKIRQKAEALLGITENEFNILLSR
ncbi:MAG: hypothetical protein DRP09_21685 [Candidatus Thorarchaeota archaeon]|nr:MAG: hypothetical protein DRP09_21685 [Candidatus Thorarchaeota archaeon]